MSLTLGLTGMDQATELALKAAFNDIGQRIRGWSMVGENDADYIIVDMDSMYGPMSWLRLHAAGKRIIGLTSAPRTQADFRLPRPFDAHQLATVLGEIGAARSRTGPRGRARADTAAGGCRSNSGARTAGRSCCNSCSNSCSNSRSNSCA
jgi:hypothetical protein